MEYNSNHGQMSVPLQGDQAPAMCRVALKGDLPGTRGARGMMIKAPTNRDHLAQAIGQEQVGTIQEISE